jgi:hypothetical protein
MLNVGDFIRAARTRNLYSATSVDQLPHMVASWAMFGHQFLMPVPDVDRTQLFICIGGNPVASAGSIMGAPGFEKRIDALRARGGRFVVIDPRRRNRPSQTTTCRSVPHRRLPAARAVARSVRGAVQIGTSSPRRRAGNPPRCAARPSTARNRPHRNCS